jgi:hypothetical protein
MNIERKMEFIVENLAALTVSQQKTDRQMRSLERLVKDGDANAHQSQASSRGHRREVRTLAKLFKSRRERTQEKAQLGPLTGLVYTEVRCRAKEVGESPLFYCF